MSKYQAYPEYKDSGIEWLGDIPEHWVVAELKRYSRVQGGYAFSSDSFVDSGIPVIRIGDIKQDGTISLESCKYIQDEVSTQYKDFEVRSGDLLMAMTGATIGKAGWFKGSQRALLNQRVGSFKCNKSFLNYKFFWYVLNSLGYQEYIKITAFGGAQPNISDTGMVSYQSAIPDLIEQEKIASFLNHETAKIDTLIDKQQQLIQLLKEKRQAVISHAVTKGLNPSAPMRDSGVEWLGKVPEHWSFPKVKWFFKTESGGTPNTSRYEEYYQDGDIPWIRSTDLNNNELFETPIAITSKAIRESACTVIPTNSVLIAMYGGAGTIGKHTLLKFESAINQAVCAILPTNKINPDFLHLYVEFYRPYWMVGAEGARKDPNINQETIRELVVSSPPYDEQVEIVKVIQQKIAVIDQTVSKCEKNIQLMQERRVALISAAVTGKIDVRHHASHPAGNDTSEVSA